VKELALYAQDTITKGNWAFNLGMRSIFIEAVPIGNLSRGWVSLTTSKTNSVLRASYSRVLETPFNGT